MMAGLLAAAAFAQGYSPGEAASKMTLPPGFEAQLVACEPMVRQPVAIEFDDRGRLWVVQYMQYPNPEGLKRVKVDRYSRTEYDRVPEPPPRGPRGNDVITILEDTDRDGRMDVSRNFVEGLNLCTGLAFGYGGVFVIQAPYLLFYPDANRDDVPDGDPEVLLTGFGMEDAHSVANSLTWGPDGWLYGNQGSTVTARIDGIEFQQGVWRYHPVARKFELFCEGGGNMWGLDFDWDGNLIASTNFGPFIGLHAEQGAYYWKQFGKHGALHNPYTYGFFEHMTHHNPQGGHVAVGGTIYDAVGYPAEYRGKYIFGNLLSHDVYWNELRRTGSTFETHNLGQLLDSHDTWFATSDLMLGPDGAIYIADWCDKRTAHPDPDATWDRSNGRVYRVVTKEMTPAPPFDLEELSTRKLVDLLEQPNKWYVRRALLRLAERRDAGAYARLRKQVARAKDPRVALNSFYALYGSGGVDEAYARASLGHALAPVRKWAVRFLGDSESIGADTAAALADLAANETDVMVRNQLACSAKRLPADAGLPIVWALARHDDAAGDPHLPLLMWWAVEQHAVAARDAVVETIGVWPATHNAWIERTLLPNLTRRYASEGNAECDAACVRLMTIADAWGARDSVMAALDLGLKDRHHAAPGEAMGSLFAMYAQQSDQPATVAHATAPVSGELREAVAAAWKTAPESPALLKLAARLGDEGAYAHAKALATNGGAGGQHVLGIEVLAESGKPDGAPVLLDIVAGKGPDAARHAALAALRHIPGDDIGATLVALYPSFDDATKAKARETLFTRAAWCRAFADAVDMGAIRAGDVPLDQVRVMANHDDAELRALIEKLWGTVRSGTPEEKLAEVRRLNNELNAAQGDPARGKEVFVQNCAKCHQLFGEGYTLGPDLTQANRMDREYMLVSLVDPNLTVRKEYTQYVVESKDQGMFNGIIADKSPGSVTLLNANDVRTTIAMSDVADLREAGTSLMPEGLITPLTGDDVRNLFAYLQGPAPSGKP
ncbi:MAG: c-type cytochrome [Candidatus Hydrogenedentes bacterium]|nr:c-type cytochrome [Candidatus Hydrogenedentota bacterium]